MSVRLTLWNRWVPVRQERTADGTTTVYFGVGSLSWQSRTADSSPPETTTGGST